MTSATFDVDPAWADVEFGAVHPMGVEVPRFAERLRMIDDRGGVAPAWFFSGSPAWVLTRHEDVRAAMLDTATFSPRRTQEVLTFPIMGPMFLGYEGHEHDAHRKVVAPQFTRRISGDYLESLLRPQAHAVIDRFSGRGEADLMSEFAKQFPLAVIGGLLGVTIEDWDRMAGWANDLLFASDRAAKQASARQFRDYLRPLLTQRRADPADDVLSLLATGQVDGEPLTEDEVMSFMLLLFPAGADTTWLAVGSMMAAVLSTPGALETLAAHPEMRAAAVEETLRWAPPVAMLPRITAQDIDIRGTRIPAGSMTLLAIVAANRDPQRFGDPDCWRLDRRPANHITFGFGEHFCLGVHLARAEMRAALDALIDRLPGLHLSEPPRFHGAAIRGPGAVRVAFEAS